ncbi:MAG: hypothetical protein GF310_11485 [candidate division Zixibacteria bacterium]|nr:hypothetical protein [candidate division Zixibacteria bacterium]
MPDKSPKRVIIRLIKYILITLILYFIYKQISSQWEQVQAYEWKINWLTFAASIVILWIGLFIKSASLKLILSSFNVELPILRAFRIMYLSNLGRYVPGKVVQFIGIMYLAKQDGIKEDVAITSFFLYQIFDTCAGIFVVFISFFLLGLSYDNISQYLPVIIILGVLIVFTMIILMRPEYLAKVMNFVRVRFKRPLVEFKLQKSIGLKLLFIYFAVWIIFGVSFYLFIQAVTEAPSDYFIESCFIYTASYLIGYWALFAPGGIGVREGVMGALLYELGGFVESVAYVVGLASRLWFMIGEITITVWALLVRSKKTHG